jgi:hypothetical protein
LSSAAEAGRDPVAATVTKGGAAMEWYLPVIWAALTAPRSFYVILDGFDLGTGILFPYAKTERSATR